MKVTVTLGDAGFEAEADATEREMMLVLYRLWLNAMESSGADAVKLEALTTRLRTQKRCLGGSRRRGQHTGEPLMALDLSQLEAEVTGTTASMGRPRR